MYTKFNHILVVYIRFSPTTPYSVAKLITPRMGVTQDLDLNSFYYVMWGIRADPITVNGSIQPHTLGGQLIFPALSMNLVQPVDGIMLQQPAPVS